MSVNNLIEHLTLTEQEIIHILRRNDEQFARKVLAFAFGMDNYMRKRRNHLEQDEGECEGQCGG